MSNYSYKIESYKEVEVGRELLEFIEKVEIENFNQWSLEKSDVCNLIRSNIEILIKNHGEIYLIKKGKFVQGIVGLFENLWDSNFFKLKTYRISFFYLRSDLTGTERSNVSNILSEHVLEVLSKNNVEHCMADISAWDSNISEGIQNIGFKHILGWSDCFIPKNQEKQLNNDYSLGPIKKNELAYISGLSKDYFKGGRFYLDPNFDNETVDLLYNNLILNSYDSSNSEIVVLRKNSDPIGAFICKDISYNFMEKFKVQSLRLLVFDKSKSEPGLATKFIHDIAIYLYENTGCDLVVSGVELHNLPSLKIHSKAGYKLNYVHNAFHWWKPKND